MIELTKNTWAAYSNPAAFVSQKTQEMIIRVISYDDWGRADICFCFATVNTVAIAIIARTNYLKKSRIISVVCILDGTFLLWAWSQHPLGGVLKNLQSNNAVLTEQTGIHTDNNTRHQQLIEEERQTLEAANAKLSETQQNLSETQQNLSETEKSIRATNGMTREQLVQIAGQVTRLTAENDRAVAENNRQEAVTARLEAANIEHQKLLNEQRALNAQSTQHMVESVKNVINEKGSELKEDLKQAIIQAVERPQHFSALTPCNLQA